MANVPTRLNILNYIMVIAFSLSAYAQFNDPDAGLWVAIYGAAAVISLFWKWKLLSRFWYQLLFGVTAVYALYLLATHAGQLSFEGVFDSVSMKSQSVEVIREIGGLLIVSVWMAVLGFYKGGKEMFKR